MLVLTGVFAALNRWVIKRSSLDKKLEICPLCVGVSVTWLLILIGIVKGFLPPTEWRLAAAALMGGSVSGIAHQGEKKFQWAKRRGLLFKTIVLAAGFLFVYEVIQNINVWSVIFSGIILLVLAYFLFLRKEVVNDWQAEHRQESEEIKSIEDKLKNCC